MSPHAQALHELLAHIDKLKALHRAAESPTFGQVEALFDHADQVRRAFAVPTPAARAPWPTTQTATNCEKVVMRHSDTSAHATEKAARRLVELVLAQLTEAS